MEITMGILLKSAYAPYNPEDGNRYLVETLWPEGIDTYFLSPYKWVQELAPSYYLKEMSNWKNWTSEQFKDAYRKQLQEPDRRSWFDRIANDARNKTITLLHRCKKKERQITPEDTTVYFLRAFFDEALKKGQRSASVVD